MIFKIDVLNVCGLALVLFVAWVVYQRTGSIESAVVSGAAVVVIVLMLFTPIGNGTTTETTTPTPTTSTPPAPPHLPDADELRPPAGCERPLRGQTA
ncbi:hypothetical protein [Streptomyces sp. NPDC058757]|uniref:hypothetical protein n=1 Tax=Streptomyces sp. NPDC058757 TaxID=3346626 RepID=UPI00368AFF48